MEINKIIKDFETLIQGCNQQNRVKEEAKIADLAKKIITHSKESSLIGTDIDKILSTIESGFKSNLFQIISEETSISLLKLASRCEYLKEQIAGIKPIDEGWVLIDSPISIQDPSLFENKPTGIPNQGNTCFAASFLQIVENDPIMKKAIESLIPEGHDLKKVHRQYQEKLRNPEARIEIKQLRNVLGNVKSTNQEDICELMLLSSSGFNIPNDGKIFLDNGQAHQFGSESFAYNLENGTLRSESRGYQNNFPFFNCSLGEVVEGSEITELLLNTFLSTPILPSDTVYLGIARFRNDGSKINTRINVPMNLEIPLEIQHPDFPNHNQIYQLQGFVVHEGTTLHSGHYVAYLKKGDKFYRANDSQISEIDIETFLDQASQSYLLNYSKS